MKNINIYIQEGFYKNVGVNISNTLNSMLREPENRDKRFEPEKKYFTLDNKRLILNVKNFRGSYKGHFYFYKDFEVSIPTASYVFSLIEERIIERLDGKRNVVFHVNLQYLKEEKYKVWIHVWDEVTKRTMGSIIFKEINISEYRDEQAE